MTAVTRRTVLQTVAAGAALAAAPSAAEARGRTAADDDLGLLFDGTRCVGCRACTVKCREANGRVPEVKVVDGVAYDAPLDLGPQTLTVIKRWTEGDREGFVKAQCMHCVEPACVSVCMLGALHKEPHGVVGYDVTKCVGCRYCQVACPFNVPRFEWSSATPRITKCELCRHRWQDAERAQAQADEPGPERAGGPGERRIPPRSGGDPSTPPVRMSKGAACAEACPRDAIRFGRRADLLAEARRRLAATPEAYYQKIYGERDGGGTGVLVLAAVPFETLGLPVLGKEPVPALGERIQHGIYQGFVAPVALFGALAFVTWRNRRTSQGEDQR